MTVLTGTQRPDLTVPRDPLVGFRHDQDWRVDLLDLDENYVSELGGVLSGSVDFSVHTQVRSSGQLVVDEPGAVDWHRHRLQVVYTFRDEAGQDREYPLGVFLPTVADTDFDDFGSTAPVDFYDKLSILNGGGVGAWSVPAGTTVVDAVAQVLATVGESKMAAPADGGGSLKQAMVWEPGTTRLRIINDILAAGNFFSLWVDGRGVWRLDPYVEPDRRGVAWTHEEGPRAVFEDRFKHEADGWEVPNHVIITGRPERGEDGEDLPAPWAEARNMNTDDPFSIPARGHENTHVETDFDATTTGELGRIAARRLVELSGVTSTFRLSHDYLPIDLNSAVRLRVPTAGVDVLTVLQSWSWSWDADDPEGPGMVTASYREVQQ